MPTRQLGLVSFAVAAVTLLLVVLNAFLVVRNQGVEAEVQQRQVIINQSLQINQVSNALLQMLGQVAVRTHDPQISALLNEFGISVTETPSTPGTSPAMSPMPPATP